MTLRTEIWSLAGCVGVVAATLLVPTTTPTCEPHVLHNQSVDVLWKRSRRRDTPVCAAREIKLLELAQSSPSHRPWRISWQQ